MKKVAIIASIIATFILVGVGFYILGKNQIRFFGSIADKNTFVEVTQTPNQNITQPGEVNYQKTQNNNTPANIQTQTVQGGGILTFPKYQLTYPVIWTADKKNETPDIERITLTYQDYSLSVLEGGFGGSACLYPGDSDIEGPSARYTNYVDITGKSGDLFRRGWSEDGMFGICQKTGYGWGAPTLFGSISYSTPASPSAEVILQMDSILSSITRI